jgi:hypothetical protein
MFFVSERHTYNLQKVLILKCAVSTIKLSEYPLTPQALNQ